MLIAVVTGLTGAKLRYFGGMNFCRCEKPFVGKACRARGEHFPGWEKLAALVGDLFPSGKSLLGFRGTFSRVGKTCCVLRQAFNDNILAAVISRSLTSGRMRYAPTFFGEKLILNNAIHHRIPNE